MAESLVDNRALPSRKDDAPTSRRSENLIKLKIPYVKPSGKPGLQWPNTMKHSKFLLRYKVPILFAICSIVALLLLMVSITLLTEKYDDNLSQSDLEKLMENDSKEDYNVFISGNELKNDEADLLLDQVIYNDFDESDKSLRRVRRIRKRQAPNIFSSNSDDGSLSRATKLHRVQTGSKSPSETEKIRAENFLSKMDDHSDKKMSLRKRGLQEKEKSRLCKRSVMECKTVLEAMQSLAKTAANNVDSLNQLMDQLQMNEELKNTDPQKFQTFLQCIECNEMTNDDSIKFIDISEQDETLDYNPPVYQNRQSEMTNALTIAEMLNNPKPAATTKRMIGQMERMEDMNDYPMSWMDANIYDPNIKKTVDIATTKNKTEDMEVTYIIKNTTIIKHLPKVESREELSQPENMQFQMPSFNTPRPEENFGWAEVTKTYTKVEFPTTTMTPDQRKSDPGWNQEPRNIQSGARIATGPHRQPNKNNYDPSAVIFPTAETSKTSEQSQFPHPGLWSPYPVCFFGSPNAGSPPGSLVRQPMTSPASSPAGFPFMNNQFPQRGFSYASSPMGQGFTPLQYQQQFPYGNLGVGFQQVPHMGPTAPGGQSFFPNFGNVPTAPGAASRTPYYCTYMPAPPYQYQSQPPVAEYQREQDYPPTSVTGRLNTVNVYPEETNYAEYEEGCTKNQIRCRDGGRCIPKKARCDGKVDCPGASDERLCNCRYIISKDRICDGYFDCPRGEDEMDCFGCGVIHFSCNGWEKRDGEEKECVPGWQRCDGTKHCSNGKDEEDCSILTASFLGIAHTSMIGFTSGYLHRNYQGAWYPACSSGESWAKEACTAETGFPLRSSPLIRHEPLPPGEYSGPYVVQALDGSVEVINKCEETAVYVKCPQLPCGTRVLSHHELETPFSRSEDSFLGMSNNATNSTNNVIDQILGSLRYAQTNESTNANEMVGAESRVVGGTASHPKAWPFVVAIYKDGTYSCGGIIINKYWILSAAHCFAGFPMHYYEIRAGVLRRRSFSSTSQTRRANIIKIHPSYKANTMKNDLALIKVDKALLFNRWVRPACLPKMWRPVNSFSKEPLFDSTCVVAGWGATSEHGPDHQLREASIPISRECKHPEDRNDAELCAGLPEGGRDACQGDSGGPLMCKFPDADNQWYAAGIVSHGEGCGRPNEPGAYTRVSRFVDWIDAVVVDQNPVVNGPKPLSTCPGFSCDEGRGKCLLSTNRCDGVVDCLYAEDEINCPRTMYRMRDNPGDDGADFSDSEFVGQSNPEYQDEIIIRVKTPQFFDDETLNDQIPAVFPTFNIQNTPTTPNEATSTTHSTNTDQPPTTAIKPKPYPGPYVDKDHFTCTRILQSLTVDKRCNRIIDCEDGTDEDNCSCKDYLASLSPESICNGHVDCNDGSDEENCGFCRNNEFTCTRSGTCIPDWKLCDKKVDCTNMEDELDCFALTSGHEIIVDFDGRPELNLAGVVTKWENRTWHPLCVNQKETNLPGLANQFCEYFGFGSPELSHPIVVPDTPITVKESTKNLISPYEYPPSFKLPEGNVKTCDGIYIRCKPVVSAKATRFAVTNPLNTNIHHLWPWQAYIFVDGRYHCPATLLDHSWLLVSSRCTVNLNLGSNYTMAVVGVAPTYLHVNGPHQQISRIDYIKPIKKLNAALLHLESPVNQTRNVQPIFVQKRIFPPTDKDDCVAIGVDKKYRTNTTFLQPVPEPCPLCYRCYKSQRSVNDCKNETLSNWSGTIVCRGSDSWYPAATFHEKDILCGFQMTQIVNSIDYGNALLTEVMEGNLETIAPPNCPGYRCPFGKCLSWDKICNGVDDCRDRSDENPVYCLIRKEECKTFGGPACKCTKSELTCANGQCVPKEAFCDSKVDCEDGSDETPHCTCADYLRLTAPERVCNNVRDCRDKSDENSEDCKCDGNRFKCSGGVNASETCISRDLVCDGQLDCPNGEDEEICRGIQGSMTDPRGTGQVLRRSFGIWHSECFPLPVTSTKKVSEICRTMHYNRGEPLRLENPDTVYGKAMVPDRDEFYMIRVNSKAWITLRKNRPLVTLVVASKPCHRAFIRCV